MYPLQWMGAVRMRVQTADKNITIIHTNPVHQLMSGKEKSCVFVKKKKKSISEMFLYIYLKYPMRLSKYCNNLTAFACFKTFFVSVLKFLLLLELKWYDNFTIIVTRVWETCFKAYLF